MNLEKIKSVDHQFSQSETDAILCVLPLPSYAGPISKKLRKGQTDAYTKLIRGSNKFNTLEFAAIVTAVELSIHLMSGKAPALTQKIQRDAVWLSEIKNHFFVLNSLHSQFRCIADELRLDT